MAVSQDNLIWIDLEMTGLGPRYGRHYRGGDHYHRC